MMQCDYGCKRNARFILKNGKYCCESHYNKCTAIRKKNARGVKKAYKEERKGYTYNPNSAWNKGLTKETNESVNKASKTLLRRFNTGEIQGGFNGKHHSILTRKILSEKANSFNNGYVKTKYYEVYCPFIKTSCKVQGTWEKRYAEYLNANNISWVKDRKINMPYVVNEINKIYYPDFYLPDTDTYIEIKGYMWKGDKEKMEAVTNQHNDKNIIIITKLPI